MYNMDYIKTLEKEVLKVIKEFCKNDYVPDNFRIETIVGDINNDVFDVYKFYDNNEQDLKYHVNYCQGEFTLMTYNTNWDYEMGESDKMAGIFI